MSKLSIILGICLNKDLENKLQVNCTLEQYNDLLLSKPDEIILIPSNEMSDAIIGLHCKQYIDIESFIDMPLEIPIVSMVDTLYVVDTIRKLTGECIPPFDIKYYHYLYD